MAHFEAKKREHGGVTSTQCLISAGAGRFGGTKQDQKRGNEDLESQNGPTQASDVYGPIESPSDGELSSGKLALLLNYKKLAEEFLVANGDPKAPLEFDTYARQCFIHCSLTRLHSECSVLPDKFFEKAQTDKDLLSTEIKKLIPRLRSADPIGADVDCQDLAQMMIDKQDEMTAELVYHFEVYFQLIRLPLKQLWFLRPKFRTAGHRMYEKSTLSYHRAREFANLVKSQPAFDPIKLDGIPYDIVEIFKSLEAPLRQHPTLSSEVLSLDRLPLSIFKNHLERIKRECSLAYLKTDRNVCNMIATLKDEEYVRDIELARSDKEDYAHSLDYVSKINHANNILKLVVHGYAEALKSVLDP